MAFKHNQKPPLLSQTFSRLDRSRETIVLLEQFREIPIWSTATLFKSDSSHLLKAGKAVLPDTVLPLFPLVDFVYQTCDSRLRYYRHERVSAPAWMMSDILQKRHCSLADDGTLENGNYAMLYNEEECREWEVAFEESTRRPPEPSPPAEGYYRVTVKGGHVGKHRYYPIALPVMASSPEDAAKKAIALPRVKHKNHTDVLSVEEIDQAAFLEQCRQNKDNPYFQARNSYDVKTWKQTHRTEFVDDGSTGMSETKRHQRRNR